MRINAINSVYSKPAKMNKANRALKLSENTSEQNTSAPNFKGKLFKNKRCRDAAITGFCIGFLNPALGAVTMAAAFIADKNMDDDEHKGDKK